MKQVDQTHINDRAIALAKDAMKLHILSFRMGQGLSKDEDYRACQRIIAEADSLERDIMSMAAEVSTGEAITALARNPQVYRSAAR